MLEPDINAYRTMQGLIVVSRTVREDTKHMWTNPAMLIIQGQGQNSQMAFAEFLNFSKDNTCEVSKAFIDANFIEFEPDDFLKDSYKNFESQVKAQKAGIQLASSTDMKNLSNVKDIQNRFKK